jgi:hypothetical protein
VNVALFELRLNVPALAVQFDPKVVRLKSSLIIVPFAVTVCVILVPLPDKMFWLFKLSVVNNADPDAFCIWNAVVEFVEFLATMSLALRLRRPVLLKLPSLKVVLPAPVTTPPRK